MSKLSQAENRFVLHWGEMGTRWGINRTVAQIHALLYLSPRALSADEICERLSVARSTVSTGLRELQSWELVKKVHRLGDRRDHFESLTDVWEMFRLVLLGRKRREVDPTLEMLRGCVAELKSAQQGGAHTLERLVGMLEFFEAINAAYEQLEALPNSTLRQLATAGERLRSVLKRVAA